MFLYHLVREKNRTRNITCWHIVVWEEVMLSGQQEKTVTEESVDQEIFVPHTQLVNFPVCYNSGKFESLLHYAVMAIDKSF